LLSPHSYLFYQHQQLIIPISINLDSFNKNQFKMSLGGLFGGRRQPSSAEKLAMIEMELELNTTMFDK
jgi:hypothetical protein